MPSVVDTSVKFFNENFPGAPVLSGTAGAGLSVLDAVLVTGFGLRTATSLVVDGGVATITLPNHAQNSALLYSVIEVAGVTGTLAGLNGEQRVTAATATTLQFATAAADGTAVGTVTVKTAPLGFAKVYTGTNLAAFRSNDVTGRRMFLRVDDSGASAMRVRAYESMSSISVGTGAFPTTAQAPSPGRAWHKSVSASGGAIAWDVIGDKRGFYWCPLPGVEQYPQYAGQATNWFGDIVNFKSNDSFSSALWASTEASVAEVANGSVHRNVDMAGVAYFARSYTGLGSSIAAFARSESGSGYMSGADTTFGTFPSPTDGAMRIASVGAFQGASTGTTAIPRGRMPGIYHVPQAGLHQAFQRGDYAVGAVSPVLNHKLKVIFAGFYYYETSEDISGRILFDITGPWR